MEVAKPLQMQAYEHIKSRIVDEKLEYGAVYSETKLAGEIGISRTPIRDAIHRLAQEGFLEIIPSKGFALRRMSPQEIEDTYQVRCAIECFCTMMAARESGTRRAREFIARSDKILAAQENILRQSHDVEEFYERDQAFHHGIVGYAENQAFSQLFNSYIHRIKRLAVSTLKLPQRMETTLQEHRAVLEAIKQGDPFEAYETTRTHLEAPKKITLRNLKP